MNRGVYVLFVSVALMSLNGCAVGTEGEEPRQETGKTARSGTIETPPAAAADEAQEVIEAPFFDESNTRTVADNPFMGKEPGVPEAPHSHIPAPKPPGPQH
jgi:hypothetical protein